MKIDTPDDSEAIGQEGQAPAPRSLVCGLGAMGTRYLEALLRFGHRVVGCDIDATRLTQARELAWSLGATDRFEGHCEIQGGDFSTAIFAGPAPSRVSCLEQFCAQGRAERILLEKPLGVSDFDLNAIERIADDVGNVYVHFPRRNETFLRSLKAKLSPSEEVMITVCGGAKGIGCNAIHYLDLLFYFSDAPESRVLAGEISQDFVPSPRGRDYRDYGGKFLVQSGKVSLFVDLAASSSAPPILTLRGEHWIATIDEHGWRCLLRTRSPDSRAPNHHYGRDYRDEIHGVAVPAGPSELVPRWLGGEMVFLSLSEALLSHRLLLTILTQGGATPPYYFT